MFFKLRFFCAFFLFSASVFTQENSESLDKRMKLYLQKADSCKVKFDYENSFKYISEVLSYAKENDDINSEILCNVKLIELYRHATLFDRSEFYLLRAEYLISKSKTKVSDFNLMYLYNRKAALFSEFYNVPDSTLFYSKKALAIANKIKNKDFQFTSLMEIGFFF